MATTLDHGLDDVEAIHEAPVSHGLQVVSIAKSYDKRTVLTDVSVSVGRGEVIGLLGPNGAGKSTTMRMILGLDNPTTGHALVDGVPERHGSQDGSGEVELGHQAAPREVGVAVPVAPRRETTLRGFTPTIVVGSSAAARSAA